MRLIGWLCVIAAPLAMTLSVLLARVNNRVYGERRNTAGQTSPTTPTTNRRSDFGGGFSRSTQAGR